MMYFSVTRSTRLVQVLKMSSERVGEMSKHDEVISVVYGCKGMFLYLCDVYMCVLSMYWVRFLCFEQFICIVLGLVGSL